MMAPRSLTNRKLESVGKADLAELSAELGVPVNRSDARGVIAARVVERNAPQAVDAFIKRKYAEGVQYRRENVISDEDLLAELRKVQAIDWGVVQGQLDGKIQREYVRKFSRYDDLVQGVAGKLHSEVTDYVVSSWYNHWSTVLIEDHISMHPNVVPTLKNIAGVDLFFKDTPFDLKVTQVPKSWAAEDAIADPISLARWLYENQGEQRFGAHNRLYVLLIDSSDVDRSWRLKRETDIVYPQIDAFLDTATVDESDELTFSHGDDSHAPTCKMLLITK